MLPANFRRIMQEQWLNLGDAWANDITFQQEKAAGYDEGNRHRDQQDDADLSDVSYED
jgi:hypothetical protein